MKKLITIYKDKKKHKKNKLIWIIKIKKNKIIIGIDLGIKEYAITYNGKFHKHYPNFNKNNDLMKIRKDINEINKKGFFYLDKKEVRLFIKLTKELNELISNYIKAIVNDIIKSKPSIIKIEELNIAEMKNYNINNFDNHKFLNKLIDDCHWDLFRELLEDKCKNNNIKLLLVPQYYPSSKRCSNCGSYKKILLDDRTFRCESCGLIIDRDENASINIRNYNLQ